ncbi:MAG: exopolysaccharide biosynthesis protein [Bacteroidaceae bacterium]|nr:exopolysaccharide biosynthesis protein [Bacteroidaceae bacterium]
MKKVTLFPNLITKSNPYIQDFIDAFNSQDGVTVVNPPHKNPLLSILKKKYWGDTFVFNWFESIPDFKYGPLQAFIAVFFITFIKLSGRKIVWILHNKHPHAKKYGLLKKALTFLIVKYADLIITHATDGVELIKQNYPFAYGKVHFLHHPTKNRLSDIDCSNVEMEYDLLIWGAIAKYKGIIEFIDYLRQHSETKVKVCLIGKCASAELFNELNGKLPSNVTFIHKSMPFEELAEYIRRSQFVLAPYFSDSILSSGILMDSLSFGAKVIGPATGSFKDYSHEPLLKVYTFEEFGDVFNIIEQKKLIPVSKEDYQTFLEQHNWQSFISQLLNLLN